MDITHIGHSCFKLRGKSASVITDPFDPEMVGIKYSKLETDIVTISHGHNDHNFTGQLTGNPTVISGPGEYEVKGIRIIGISSFHDGEGGTLRGRNIMYHIEIDGISIVHLGDLGHKLDEKQTEHLDRVDILLIPVGGIYTITAPEAVAVVSQLEPRITIPMHYGSSNLNQKNFGQLSDVISFLKEMAKEGIVAQPKLSITRDKLPIEPTVVVLES